MNLCKIGIHDYPKKWTIIRSGRFSDTNSPFTEQKKICSKCNKVKYKLRS